MCKWLTTLGYTILLIVAILILLPLLFGFVAERKCKQIINAINDTTVLSAKIIDYQRGWFSANATAQLSLDKFELPNKELQQLTINANIIHGPALMDWARFHFVQAMVDAAINLNAAQNQWLKRDDDADPIATIKVKFKLNGNTDIILNSPPLIYQSQENSLNWSGLKIKSIYSPSYNQVKSKIDFSGIDLKTKNINFHLGEITGTYQGIKTSSGLWLGERNLQLDAIIITNSNNRGVAFGDVNIQNIIAANEKNLVNITTAITIGNLNINNGIYNQNKLDLKINNLDPPLLTQLQQQLLSSKIISSPTSVLFDTVMSLLNNGSEIQIKQLVTNTPWGKLLSTANIALANQPNNIGLLAAITGSTVNLNIKTERALASHLLEKFYHNLPTKQPYDPAKQAEITLTTWQQSGKILMMKDDPYLHLSFDYKNNQLTINGKQLILTTKP